MTNTASAADHLGVTVNGLSFGYGRTPVFNGLHVRITEPGVYGVFGPNGSGKSTLLKLLAGLLTPDSGTLRVGGHVPRRREIGFLDQVYIVPEEFHLPDLTAVQLARRHAPFYSAFRGDLFFRYLEALRTRTDQRFYRMSLGQKKKVTIAFALATGTALLLMDEPTNGLDIESRSVFKRLLAEPEHAQRIVLISTHQAHDLERCLRSVWFIDSGRWVVNAPMAELSQHLISGVSAGHEVPEDVLFSEPIGEHTIWLAARQSQARMESRIPLELLYKALNHDKKAVLAALPTSWQTVAAP